MNIGNVRILADDLTGALDTAAAFAGKVPVFIDQPPVPDLRQENDVVSVLASATRDVPVDTLPSRLQAALEWLRSGSIAFKKVDSLLRGNSFAETAWIGRKGRFDLTVFAPAFPAQGRITFDNRQWVVKPDGTRRSIALPLHEAFAEFDRHTCATLDREHATPCDIWIPEVRSDADLDHVVAGAEKAALGKRLWCGSAGLAHALARHWKLAPSPEKTRPLTSGKGPSVLVSASFQPVLREQWALLFARRETLAIARHANDDEISAALNLASVGTREIWFDLSPAERIPAELAVQQLVRQTARIVDELPRPGEVIVVGGDTLLGLCRATGATALLAHPAVRPGWGCARLIGGSWDGVPCYSRSGAFGEPDDLVQMIRLLRGSQTT